MPDLACYGLDCGDDHRSFCRNDRTLELHARLQVVDAKLFPINRGSGRLRDIRKMPESAIFHFHDQIIAVHSVNFAAVDRYVVAGLARRRPGCYAVQSRVRRENRPGCVDQ